ncbi:GNAT family N-acetyltransferase [Candidatus Saccharibacteria bacterium]|nr:GNAT family N-acetyltransferase [Candidatus Saccharibacteria bacterium]
MKLAPVDFTNYKKAIKMQKEIFPEEDGTINILASLDRDLFMQKTGLFYEDDHVKYYIAYHKDEAVGITGLYYYNNDRESAWLAWFGVLPDKRRKHYGERIIAQTIEIAKQKGFNVIRLYTDAISNATAIKLYEKLGFVGEKYSAEELPYDCYIYSKSLHGEKVQLWNNKMLDLAFQSELENVPKDKIKEILKSYEQQNKNNI